MSFEYYGDILKKKHQTDFCVSVIEEGAKEVFFHCHLLFLIASWPSFNQKHVIQGSKEETLAKIDRMKGKKKTFKDLNPECVRAIITYFYIQDHSIWRPFSSPDLAKDLLKAIEEIGVEDEFPVLYSHLNVEDIDKFWYGAFMNDVISQNPNHPINAMFRKDKLTDHEVLIKDCLIHLSNAQFSVGKTKYFAHRCIIDQSPFFAKAMSEEWGSNQMIQVDDISNDVFLLIYHYLYSVKIEIDASNAVDLLYWSNLFLLEKLQYRVESTLDSYITDDNATSLLSIGKSINSRNLMERLKTFIVQRIVGDEKKYMEFFCKSIEEKELVSDIIFSVRQIQHNVKKGVSNGQVLSNMAFTPSFRF